MVIRADVEQEEKSSQSEGSLPSLSGLKFGSRSVSTPQLQRSSLLAVSTALLTVVATGCSTTSLSWRSFNPFSGHPEATEAPTQTDEKVASTLNTSAAENTVEQTGGFTATAKSAWNATTGAVTSVFSRSKDASEETSTVVDDPLSLSNSPEKVNAEIYLANGQLWESTGDLAKAMESYTRALGSDPNNGPALSNIARIHFRQQNYTEAVKHFRAAADVQPNEAGLQNDLGLALSKQGQVSPAIEHLQKSLELSPGNSRYANNLASVLFENGHEQAALATLSEHNKPAVAHFNIAFLYFQAGKKLQARDHLKEVMEYEVLSEEDPAIKRAVDRTREMLAGMKGDLDLTLESEHRVASRPNPVERSVSDYVSDSTTESNPPSLATESTLTLPVGDGVNNTGTEQPQ